MNKPHDYDTAKATSEREALPAGGYICRITQVKEAVSQSGREMIKIGLDIAEGKEKGRFTEIFNADKRADKKWPCIAYQCTRAFDGSDDTNPDFKGILESVKKSNSGFEVVWGDKFCENLKDRLVGVIFRREQFMGKDGKLHWGTKPYRFRSVETIKSGNFTIPEDFPYKSKNNAGANNSAPLPSDLSDFEEVISESDLPF